MIPRRIKKRDDNEGDVVLALRTAGHRVFLIDEPCDLLVQCRCGRWWALEVKNPETHARGKGKEMRTPKQVATASSLWQPIPEVTNGLEAMQFMDACSCDV